MTTKTPNYKFELVDFNTKPWHTKEHNNWRIIDSVFSNFITVSDLQGIWENAIAVTVGQKYVDPDLDTMWKVLVAHTTPSTGTFTASRTANPTYWSSFTVEVTARGTWVASTGYSPNDFIDDGAEKFGVALSSFTSTTSFAADVTAGNISVLIDVSTPIASATASAAAAAASAGTVDLPAAVDALDYLRRNAGNTAYEVRTPAQVLTDIDAVAGPASATDSSLARFDGTTGKLLQNSGVTVDDSGYVGIGTASPSAPLNVAANTATDAVRITQIGAGNSFVVEDSANPDSTPFVITAAGNVGIGTTAPASTLEVNGTISATTFGTSSQNAYGARTVSTASPTSGSDGDIWYKY